ncbi:AlkZ family DNA glycosylase [Candidatus Bathyarchaeota archaeon]|nr:AlkZ family DNA glycosylase [Candidatus Bathyarchaeota archaeon]
MTEADLETISPATLTRLYFANHFLLHKADHRKIIDVVDRICGLHSQLPSTPYLSLWNRIQDFKPEMLDHALYKEKSLVKTWVMRGTLHVFPSRDLPIYINALRRMWFEHHGRFMHRPEWPSLEKRKNLLYPKIQQALSQGPLTRKKLGEKVFLALKDKAEISIKIFSAWGGILKETAYLGLTVSAEPCGKEACFARLDKWLPKINLDKTDEATARRKLLLKYLHGYGPATAQDFACWSGLLTSEAKTTIQECLAEIKEIHVQGSREAYWLTKNDFEVLKKLNMEEKAPIRLLPKYDSYVLGHKDRTRIIRKELLQRVYRPVVGEVAATLLINGHIAGTWTHKKTSRKLTVAIEPFEQLDAETTTELHRTVEELGAYMNVEHAQIILNK